jgi:hypothetical protein
MKQVMRMALMVGVAVGAWAVSSDRGYTQAADPNAAPNPYRLDEVVSVERHKKRYLAALAKGRAPTVAARMAGLARSTVYKWRREDVEFAAAWADCVEQGLDLLEDRAYQRAMKNSDQLLMFQLRARRPEVYGRSGDSRPQPSNFLLNITLKEHTESIPDQRN